ncbi:unnamed protein product [Closterium sp. NIES-64]|nr:unnamed protein product [Closterium sp. NIES-64]
MGNSVHEAPSAYRRFSRIGTLDLSLPRAVVISATREDKDGAKTSRRAEDGSEDHLILAHLRDKAEVEVLEDVLDEGEDGMNPNPFYEDPSHAPEPAATKDDEAEDEEEGLAGEEDVVDAAAEEGDVMAPEEEGDEADAEMGGADEWSEDGDDWWAAGRYEGEEVEEWVAGEDE